MPMLVRAFPVRPGKESAVHAFADAMRSRADEVDRFYPRHGVRRESWHLQETPFGSIVIVLSDLDPEADTAETFAHPADGFTEWFHGQVKLASGVDPREQPLGAESRCIYEWPEEDGGRVS